MNIGIYLPIPLDMFRVPGFKRQKKTKPNPSGFMPPDVANAVTAKIHPLQYDPDGKILQFTQRPASDRPLANYTALADNIAEFGARSSAEQTFRLGNDRNGGSLERLALCRRIKNSATR